MPRTTSTTRLLVWRAHPGYALAWAVNVALAAGLGGSALLTLPSRFAAPTYDGLRQLGIPVWGALLVAYAAALIVGAFLPTRAMMATFGLGAVMYFTIGVYFTVGLPDPRASPWGPFAFLAYAVWQCTQAEAYRQAARAARLADTPPRDPDGSNHASIPDTA